MIEAGTKTYHEKQCDFIIGFGGGSPLDSVKAISILSVMGGKIADLVGKEISCCVPPVAAIPTTAGTGSEVTQFTIITDTQTDVKMLLKGVSKKLLWEKSIKWRRMPWKAAVRLIR